MTPALRWLAQRSGDPGDPKITTEGGWPAMARACVPSTWEMKGEIADPLGWLVAAKP